MKQKIILITGGAKGIGLATTKLLSLNNKVIIIDNDTEACKKIFNHNIDVYNEDITDYKKMKEIIDELFVKYKNIDILINNAAIQTTNKLLEMPIDDWKNVIDVNLNGTFIISQLVAKRMKNNSTILNIISSHYSKPRPERLNYDVSKAGIALMTKGFALELSNRKITVNALAIGATYTSMNYIYELDKNTEKVALEKIPMKKITTADDIAKYINIIVSELSEFATGSIFTIDGGRSLI